MAYRFIALILLLACSLAHRPSPKGGRAFPPKGSPHPSRRMNQVIEPSNEVLLRQQNRGNGFSGRAYYQLQQQQQKKKPFNWGLFFTFLGILYVISSCFKIRLRQKIKDGVDKKDSVQDEVKEVQEVQEVKKVKEVEEIEQKKKEKIKKKKVKSFLNKQQPVKPSQLSPPTNTNICQEKDHKEKNKDNRDNKDKQKNKDNRDKQKKKKSKKHVG